MKSQRSAMPHNHAANRAARLLFLLVCVSMGAGVSSAQTRMVSRERVAYSTNGHEYVVSPGAAPTVGVSHRRSPSVTLGFVPKHEQWASANGWRKAEPSEMEVIEGEGFTSVLREGDEGEWHGEEAPPRVRHGEYGWDEGIYDGVCEAALRSWQLHGGVASFTGPVNRGHQGSFGVYEAVNFGSPIPLGIPTEIGWQVGARMTQSNLSGSDFTLESRNQIFLTTALFHRVDRGLQWAIGVDWLHEVWYFEGDLMQVRGELSWKAECDREFGFAFAAGTTPLTADSTFRGVDPGRVAESWQSTDWYTAFFRQRFGECEENYLRAFAGFTSQSDGLLGADALMQINSRWAFQGGFTFLVPTESSGWGSDAGHAQESWNLFVGLVWTPGCSSMERSYYTPLLNVADNGTFFVDRR